MALTPEDARAKVVSFARRPGGAVALVDDDARGGRLVEVASGRELVVVWGELRDVEERSSPLRPAPWLALAFHDGRSLALADVGFAFAPDPVNTGPLPDLPAVACLRDFEHLARGAEALLAQEKHGEGRGREALSAILLCIAILDGARAAGLSIDAEERRLEGLVRAAEACA